MRKWYSNCLSANVSSRPSEFSLTVINPATHEGRGGIRILQLVLIGRLATVRARQSNTQWILITRNVARLSFSSQWINNEVILDGIPVTLTGQNEFCKSSTSVPIWTLCADALEYARLQRSPLTYGPMRQVYDRPFLIVVGTAGNVTSLTTILHDIAVFIANLHALASNARVRVVKDSDLIQSDQSVDDAALTHNLILLGDPNLNLVTARLRDSLPVQFDTSQQCGAPSTFSAQGLTADCVLKPSFQVGKNVFAATSQALLFISPGLARAASQSTRPGLTHVDESTSTAPGLCLIMSANSATSWRALARLAQPTIPPMVRAPFTNTFPDFFVVDADALESRGLGGILMAGFWDNHWKVQSDVYVSDSLFI
jgi:hypothetical protein